MLAVHVLSLLLLIGPPPGASPYSVVPTASTAKPCAGHRPVCRRPWFSAWHKSLVRQENRAEALGRYWVISQALAKVSGGDRRLARYLGAVVLAESSLRRDVHSGLGRYAKGDAGASWGLVQARLGRGARAGFKLIGVGPAPTRRALGWGARHLRRCIKRAAGSPASVFRCYGGVSNGGRKKAIAKRVAYFNRLGSPPPELAADVRRLLGLADAARRADRSAARR